MRFVLAAAVALALGLALAFYAPTARAHAQLVGSDPNSGMALAEAPRVVVLRFNEPVAPLTVLWLMPGGAEAAITIAAQGAIVSVTPPSSLPEGTHLVSWRVVSEDGHPIGGTLAFAIGSDLDLDVGPASASAVASTALPAVAARLALTIALAFGVGGAIFALGVDRGASPAAVGFARACCVATLPLAALLVGAAGLDRLAAPPWALSSLAPWETGLADPAAKAAGTAGAAGVIALLALARASPALAFVAWAAAAFSFTQSGHAATADPQALARGALAAHGAALTLWIGALPGLLVLCSAPDGAARLERFSPWGVGAVATLVFSGATLALLQAGSMAVLAASAYGAVLAVKLALVSAMILLAAMNRLLLTPALAAGSAGAVRGFRRTTGAETVLALGVIALASGFRFTPPPRALAAAAESAPIAIHLHGARVMADLTLTPGRAGPNFIEIEMLSGAFEPIAPVAVSVAFAAPDRGVEPLRLAATRRPDGVWTAGPVTLPLEGSWDARIDVLITDFEQERLGATVDLPPADADR